MTQLSNNKSKKHPTSSPFARTRRATGGLCGARKLYCYVDETGQDTKGRLFIVVAVVIEKTKDELKKKLERIESSIAKKKFKWNKTRNADRVQYIERALCLAPLKGNIYYRSFRGSKEYRDLTILTIAQAINLFLKKNSIKDYKAIIEIDGLKKSEQSKVAVILRNLGIRTEKVRGAKDESSAIIRLADMVAGFIRETIEGKKSFMKIKAYFDKKKVLYEI